MKITLPIFLVTLALSALIYPLWGTHSIAGVTAGTLFGNLAQILSLLLAAINLWRVTRAFGQSEEPKRAWMGMQICMWIWVAAQIVELHDEFQHNVQYGGFADVLWMTGYFPLLFGVFLLIRNYRSTGLPLGSRSSYVLQCLALLVLYGLLFRLSIWDQVIDPQRGVFMKTIDIGYPTMDFLLLTAGSVLLRISWMLRGGLLSRVWLLLCIGFLLLGVGDFALSNLESLNSPAYRMLDGVYFSSYFLVALAARSQELATR